MSLLLVVLDRSVFRARMRVRTSKTELGFCTWIDDTWQPLTPPVLPSVRLWEPMRRSRCNKVGT